MFVVISCRCKREPEIGSISQSTIKELFLLVDFVTREGTSSLSHESANDNFQLTAVSVLLHLIILYLVSAVA